MGGLTKAELSFILEVLKDKYGFGYSQETATVGEYEIQVGSLQAKLSIMLAAARR